jgi:hypothetical protein
MNLETFLKQEVGIREGVHLHDGVWWKQSSWGCCQPLYPLQEIAPRSARPGRIQSLVRYTHVVPAGTAAGKTRTRLLLHGEKFKNYSLQILADRKRRQAITKAVRCGLRTERIVDLEKHRRDLLEIYTTNAARNRHGLSEEWYIEHEAEWWGGLMQEFSLPGRDWFGTFHGEKLVAFLYNCLVDDTAVMLSAKSNKAFLISDPNDLVWFDAIMHYKDIAECRRVDAGWAIAVPPTVDWRKRSLEFEPVELPIFDRFNPVALGMIRAGLFAARPLLRRSSPTENRGLVFTLKTIQKRLEDLGGES